MTPVSAESTQTIQRRAPYSVFHTFPTLFAAYCTDYDRLAAFYAGDWRDPEARRAVAEEVAGHPRDREMLADILLEQNEPWGLDEATRHHIEALRREAAVAVVTGQQVGLLTGPLYTPYKTITTLQLARRLAEETGRPVVPVFWLEGGDHDLEEVASVNVLKQNEVVPLRYTGHVLPESGNLGPVGRLVLTDQIKDVIDLLDETLPPSDFHEALMALVREAYRPGATLLDAFARLMRALFPDAGLVFINPDAARFKRVAAPLFQREIRDYETSAQLVKRAGERLVAEGFHAQVQTRPSNLFFLDEAGRHPLDVRGDGFCLRDCDRSFTQGELLALLEESPEQFSPNVVLRPLMQDWLLPTAAYVGGPGEVSYFGQYKEVYAWAGVPMPIIYPRASVSLVESKVQKVLDRFALTVADFEEDLNRLFQQTVLREMEVDVDAAFNEAGRHLHEAVNSLKPQVEQVERTLIKAAESTRASLMKELEKFKARVVRAEKQKQDAVRAQLEKAQVNLFPGHGLQERMLSVLYFLNKYSPSLLQHLQTDLALDTSEHQVVEL